MVIFIQTEDRNFQYLSKAAVNSLFWQAFKLHSSLAESLPLDFVKFQEIFNLPPTGQVDYATWYKISAIYVGVTKIAELRSDGKDTEAYLLQRQ